MSYTPNVDTFADLLDRLAVEVSKVAWFENKKREEHAKSNPNAELIAKWDNSSREACELRSRIKSKINELLTEIVKTGKYEALQEVRTFRPPSESIEDVLADRYLEISEETKRKLTEGFRDIFNVE